MFQLLRSRTNVAFKARSLQRDVETDSTRIASIAQSIDEAINAAERELSGLRARVDDVLERAAITSGNASDEYLDRELPDVKQQSDFDSEISHGQRRLEELSQNISHFKFLRAALKSRFPAAGLLDRPV
jgi:chromosome segregation ATPase